MKRTPCIRHFLAFFFMFLPLLATAQIASIKGRVLDESNQPLTGVTVKVVGQKSSVVADFNGNFTISATPSKDILVFSFIGFKTKEVVLNSQTQLTVILTEDASKLDEVVVIGYGQMKKRDVTGAITQVKPSENDAAKSTSIDNLLQGKVAGLNVTNSSAMPGAAVSVQIRGANSLRGDNQPLYVIDNIPQASPAETGSNAAGDFQVEQNPLTSLNPQDIASIEVLKDASATAIYGSRGANGVILITTKSGTSGKISVSMSANTSIANVSKTLDVLGLRDFASYINSKGSTSYFFPEGSSEVRLQKTGSTYDVDDPTTYYILNERNWQNEIFQTAVSSNYNLNINGGNDKTVYYLSGAFKNINGLVSTTGMKQGDVRLNLTSNLSKALKLNVSMSGSIKNTNMLSGGDTKGGTSGSIIRAALDNAPFDFPKSELDLMLPESRSTPLSWLTGYEDFSQDNTFRGTAELNWKMTKWLTYSLRTGGNIRSNLRNRWWGLELFKGMNSNGYLSSNNINSNNYTIEHVLNATKDFSKNVSLNATLGTTYDDYNFLNTQLTGNQFSDFSLNSKGMQFATVLQYLQPSQLDYQLLSYLGRVNVSLFNRYVLTASLRADGSSKFSTGKQWGYFPSASFAWRMEEENWLKDVTFVDQMKFRLGWGQTGNQGIAPYQTMASYSKSLAYATNDGVLANALVISRLANQDLTWEITQAANVGLDFGLFKQRISGSVELYYKKTNQLLINKDLPSSVGFDFMTINQGNIDNKGLEVSLNADVFRSKDFKWNVGGNIGFNSAVITSLGLAQGNWGSQKAIAYTGNTLGDLFGPANIYMQGQAPGLFWGYQTNGIIKDSDKNSKDVSKNKLYRVGDNTAGNVKIVDQDQNDTIDVRDMTFLGNPTPKFTYGFKSSMSYKGISLDVSLTGKYGNKILNTNTFYNAFPGKDAPNILQRTYNNAWTTLNTNTNVPSVTSSRTKYKANIYDFYIEDGSYLRLSDITLSYMVPKQLIQKAGISKMNLFVTGQNLLTITKYSGYDPEVSSFAFDGTRMGIDMNGSPSARVFMAGLNVTF